MKDVMEKVEANRSAFDKLLEAIPGYKSYRDAGDRQDADKIQREYLAKMIDEGKALLDDAKEELLGSGVLDGLEELDNLHKLLDRNANRVRYASYGSTGIFSTVKIEQEDLERMHAFDLSLVENIQQLLLSIRKIGEKRDRELMKEIRTVKSELEKFNEHFDHREKMIKGVE